MNIVPQPETVVDGVIVASEMTAEEAKQCIAEIKKYLNNIRLLLLELDERRGWEALGYESMRQCMVGEFGRSQSQLYRELKAGKIEREISPHGEIGLIPEGHLRHIGKLPPEWWSSAWAFAVQTAPSKGVTTIHVAKTVARIKSELTHAQVTEIIESAIASTPTKSFYNRGDIVLICCPASAGHKYSQWNGCWGLVKSVGQLSSVEVVVAGETMRFPPSDLDIIDNPSPVFVQVAEKVVRLLKRDDLDECERYLLMGFYLRRQTFTQRQLEMLAGLIDHYEIPESM